MNLTELKQACEAATPGPWSVDLCKAEDCWRIKYGTRGHWLATVPIDGDEESSERDAAFIAMSRAAVPELIARVEAAEAELAEARALHLVAFAQAKGPAKWEIETLNSFGDWVPFSPSNADEADPSTWTRLGWSARYIARFSRAEEGSRMP